MIGIIVLIALIKVLDITESPFLCSGIYGVIVILMQLVYGRPFIDSLVVAIISFGLASIYFWLLNKFRGAGLIWWAILIVGLLIGLV